MDNKKAFSLSKYYLEKKDLNKEDVEKLWELLSYHSNLYYNSQEPIISDYEYDLLLKKLESLEKRFSLDLKSSLKVWSELKESSFEKVKHSRPMISLDNTYNEEDLRDFDERIKRLLKIEKDLDLEYMIEFKFDWLWIELVYDKWEFKRAITRWDWVEWEDVSENVKNIENIPKKIDFKDYIEFRWEIVMPISSFESLNKNFLKEWKKLFSNPRNAASWSVRMKDSRVTKTRNLKFFAYDLADFEKFALENIKSDKKTYFEMIKELDNIWFETSSYFLNCSSIDEVIKSINNFWDIKKTIDFDIDGLVIKLNDLNLRNKVWYTQHHPRYAIAYKFPAEILTTKVLSIEHSVWRTWTITPVANLEPVNIWWVVVKRATLHNYEEIKNLGLKIGDRVYIKRAWEVIPKVISVIKELRDGSEADIKIPKYCPSCETKVLKDEDKVRYHCPNEIDCPAKNHEKLAFAVGKQGFNIDWLWEKQIELFLREWIIHNLVDVFKISEKREEILGLEWFREKSVNNLIEAVKKSKKVEINTLLTALWINLVGKKTAKTLSRLFRSKDDLLNFSYSREELFELQDVWEEVASSVCNYFSSEAHKRLLGELLEILDIEYFKEKTIKSDKNSKFFWKRFCITWSFENYNRDDLIKLLEESGWDFVTSVSKNTDFLLAWDKAGSKLKKARDLWVEVLDLEEFLSFS